MYGVCKLQSRLVCIKNKMESQWNTLYHLTQVIFKQWRHTPSSITYSHASQMPQSEGLVRGRGFSPTPIALPTTPSHQLYLVPVWLIAAGEKHTPQLTGLTSDSWLLPHIPCVSAPHLSRGAPQKSTSASPHLFFFQRTCFFSIELLEQRKRSLLTAPIACLRACILSSVLTVNSLNPPLAVGSGCW